MSCTVPESINAGQGKGVDLEGWRKFRAQQPGITVMPDCFDQRALGGCSLHGATSKLSAAFRKMLKATLSHLTDFISACPSLSTYIIFHIRGS